MAQQTRHNAKASPASIAKALKGNDFPSSRGELVERARNSPEGKANPDIASVLERIPDRQYNTMAEVEEGVGKAE